MRNDKKRPKFSSYHVDVSGVVIISAPFSVIPIVCSACAPRAPLSQRNKY